MTDITDTATELDPLTARYGAAQEEFVNAAVALLARTAPGRNLAALEDLVRASCQMKAGRIIRQVREILDQPAPRVVAVKERCTGCGLAVYPTELVVTGAGRLCYACTTTALITTRP